MSEYSKLRYGYGCAVFVLSEPVLSNVNRNLKEDNYETKR